MLLKVKTLHIPRLPTQLILQKNTNITNFNDDYQVRNKFLTNLFTIRTYSGRSGRVWPNTRRGIIVHNFRMLSLLDM